MAGCQDGALRAAGAVVPQHAAQQPLPDATAPVQWVNIHIRAPRRPPASTLRTRPTIVFPSSAAYCRNGESSSSNSVEIGRVRVSLPSCAANSGVRTRSIDTEEGGFGMHLSRCTKKPSVARSR
jgi:hypothetical protein